MSSEEVDAFASMFSEAPGLLDATRERRALRRNVARNLVTNSDHGARCVQHRSTFAARQSSRSG